MATQSTLPPSSPAYGSTSARKSLSPDTESTPPTFQHRRKGVVNTCTVVGTRFDERHVVLLGVGDCLLRGDTALVREIALVSDLYFSDASETYENHDHITFRVLTKLGEPALHILERGSGSDVIHHERTDRSSVISSASYRESKPVRAGDGTVSLLSRYTVTRRERLRTCVPNLGLDHGVTDLHAFGGEFDAHRCFGVEIKLVIRKSRQDVGLPHIGVADQND